MYYISLIIQDESDARAWKCSAYGSYPNLDEAKQWIEFYRKGHCILAAWITDEKNKICFFECYVDIAGNVTR